MSNNANNAVNTNNANNVYGVSGSTDLTNNTESLNKKLWDRDFANLAENITSVSRLVVYCEEREGEQRIR